MRDQRAAERLAALARIGQRLAAAPPDAVSQRAVDAIHELLGYPYVAVARLDPADPATLVLDAVVDERCEAVRADVCSFVGAGVVSAAARTRRAQIVSDLAADRRSEFPGTALIRAEIAVPILRGERVLGVLTARRDTPFGAGDTASLQIVADQLAAALENACLSADGQRARQQARLLHGSSQRIGATLTAKQALVAFLEHVAARGRYGCTVALEDADYYGWRAAMTIRGRWSPREGLDLGEEALPYIRTGLQDPLDAGETIVIADPSRDLRIPPALRALGAAEGCAALALVPIRARGRRIGLVILSVPVVGEWAVEELQPYEAGAAQLATALDRCQQLLLLAERRRQLAVLDERQRLARDLHDSVTQQLFSLTLLAQTIAPTWRRDPAAGEQRVERVLEMSQLAMEELRTLLTDLRPERQERHAAIGPTTFPGLGRLRQAGLVATLREYVNALGCDSPPIGLDAANYAPQAAYQEEALFRIAQEALSNALKHARARLVTLTLESHSGTIRFQIADDGVGFAIDDEQHTSEQDRMSGKSGGLGFQTMRERVEALGGTLALRSAPGSGMTVEVALPAERLRRAHT